MYNPKYFKSEETDSAFALMDRYPFATIVTSLNGEIAVSHLPLTPKKIGDQIVVIGHLSRANSHWKAFEKGSTTIIFHGAHTYVTPQWYPDGGVPTWNYSVVHARGRVELVDTHEELVSCLKDLTAHAERHWPSGWEFSIPSDLPGDALVKSIVGFRMTVDSLDFKQKLSQNRTEAERAGVLQGLATRKDENSQSVLRDMQSLH